MIKSYTAGRRLQIGDAWREPGEPAPEAIGWMRVDDWEHAGYVKPNEISEDELRAELKKYKVADADHILDLVGLTAVLEGPRKTPRRVDVAPAPLKPAAKSADKTKGE